LKWKNRASGCRARQKNLHCASGFRDYVSRVDWQQFVSLIIVAAAAGALAWSWWRRRKFSFTRDTHCGCSSAGQTPDQNSIIFHARKGERPRVLIKMKR
jgi:hypothetical protein